MISELQEDLNYLTTALSGAWWLTPNERRDMMSFDMDEKNILLSDYWVPAGLMPMSAANEPAVDNSVLDEAAKMLGLNDYK